MAGVDTQVVKMQFDNAQFESSVKETINSLNKLNESVNKNTENSGKEVLSGMSKSLDDVNTKLEKTPATMETINKKFSALGVIGDQVLRNIGNGLTSILKKTINLLNAPWNQIKSGGWNRAFNLDQAEFQLTGLGLEWKSVSKDMSYAVNQTAYGLDSAAKAAAILATTGVKVSNNIKLTANNVDEMAEKFKGQHAATLIANGDLDEMSVALRAISGVAAQTGSDYDQIANIFANAAGQGRVMGNELTQLSYHGLNAAATLGKALGKSEAEVRDMASKGQISFQTFSNAMYDAFADHAIEANNTFSGALANVKAALSKIGAEVSLPFLKEMPQLLNAVRLSINDLKADLGPFIDTINSIVKSTIEGLTNIVEKIRSSLIIKDVVATLYNSFLFLAQIFIVIAGEFDKAFGPSVAKLKIFSANVRSVSNYIQVTSKVAKVLSAIFNVLFETIKTVGVAIKYFVLIIGALINKIGQLSQKVNQSGTVLNSFKIIFEKLGAAANQFKDNLVSAFQKIGDLPGVQKLTASLQRFKKVIIDPAIQKAVTAFSNFANKLNIKVPKFDGFLSVIDKIASKLADFLNKFIDFKEGIKSNAKGIKDGFSVFSSIKEILSNIWEGIKGIFSNIIAKFQEMKPAIDVIKSAGVGIKEGFSGVIGAAANSSKAMMDFSRICNTVGTYIQEFFSSMTAWSSQFSMAITSIGTGLSSGLSSLAFGVSAMGVALQTYNKVDANKILKVAGSIAILAASFYALSTVPKERLIGAVVGMATALGVLTTVMLIWNKMTQASAILGKGKTPFTKITDAVSTIVAKFADASAYAMKANAFGNMLVKFAASLAIVSGAIIALGKLKPQQLLGGIVGCLVIMASLFAVMKQIEKFATNIKPEQARLLNKLAASLLIFSFAIKVLSSAVTLLGSLKWNEMAVGLISVGALMAGLVISARFLNKVKFPLSSALAIVIFVEAIKKLSGSIEKLGGLDIPTIIKGLISIGGLLSAMVGTAILLSKFASGFKMVTIAPAILVIAIALNALINPMKRLGGMKWESIAKGLIAIGGALGIFAGLGAIIGKFPKIVLGLVSLSLTLIPLAVGLNLLMIPLKVLGAMEWKSIAKGLVAIGGALGIIVGLGAIAGTFPMISAGILVIGAAVLAMGTGMLAAGAGVLAFASGLNLLSVALAALSAMAPAAVNSAVMALTAFITGIISMIPAIGNSLINAFTTLITTLLISIRNTIDQFVKTAGVVLDAIIVLVYEYIPKFVDAVVNLIVSIVQSLAAHIQDFVAAGMAFMIGLNEGFAANIGQVIQSAWDVAIAFINGLADGLNNNRDRLDEALLNLAEAIAAFFFGDGAKDIVKAGHNIIIGIRDGIVQNLKDIVSVGPNLIKAVQDGINGDWSSLKNIGLNIVDGIVSGITGGLVHINGAGENMGHAAENGVRDATKTHSPSKVMAQIGEFLVQGLTGGMNGGQNSIYNSGYILGDKAGQGVYDGAGQQLARIKQLLVKYGLTNLASSFGVSWGSTGHYEQHNNEAPVWVEDTKAIKENTEETTNNTEETTNNTKATDDNTSAKGGNSKATKDQTESQKKLLKYLKYSDSVIQSLMSSIGGWSYAIANNVDIANGAKTVFSQLAEQIYQDSLKANDEIEDTSMTAEERLEAVQNAFSEAFKSIKDNIDGALDLFSEFNTGLSDAMSPEKMLSNAKSQVSGIKSFYQRVQMLAFKGFGKEVIDAIIEEGPSAYAKVSSMLKMTADQVSEYNKIWAGREELVMTSAAQAMVAKANVIIFKGLKERVAAEGAGQEAIMKEANAYQEMKKSGKASAEELQAQLKKVEDACTAAGTTMDKVIHKNQVSTIELTDNVKEQTKAYCELKNSGTASAEELQEALTKLNETAVNNGLTVDELINKVYDIRDASAESVLEMIDHQEELYSRLVRFEDLGDLIGSNVASSLESAFDPFGEWKDDFELTSEQLVERVQKTVNGMHQYYDQMVQIANNGGGELIAYFGDKLTPEVVNALSGVGSSSLQAMADSLIGVQQLIDSAQATVKQSWMDHGKLDGQTYQQTLQEYLAGSQSMATLAQQMGMNLSTAVQPVMTQTGMDSATVYTDALTEGFAENQEAVEADGYNNASLLTQSMASGIQEQSGTVSAAGSDLSMSVDNAVKNTLTSENGSSIGMNWVQGIINGIDAKKQAAVDAAKALAQAISQTTSGTLQIGSPSKLSYKFGRWWDMGAANGLDSASGYVENASESVSNTIVDTMRTALQEANDILSGDVSTQPVITPIINLDNAKAGIRSLGASFNSSAFRVNASLGKINTPSDRLADIESRLNGPETPGSNQYQFIQNNYSPKALSKIDIYRQTKSQFAQFRGQVNSK